MAGNRAAQKHGVYQPGELEPAIVQLRAEYLAALMSRPRRPTEGDSIERWIADVEAAAVESLDPVMRGRVDRLIESERRCRLLDRDAQRRGVQSVRGAVLAAGRFAQDEAALWDRLAARLNLQHAKPPAQTIEEWLAQTDEPEVQTSALSDEGDDDA